MTDNVPAPDSHAAHSPVGAGPRGARAADPSLEENDLLGLEALAQYEAFCSHSFPCFVFNAFH